MSVEQISDSCTCLSHWRFFRCMWSNSQPIQWYPMYYNSLTEVLDVAIPLMKPVFQQGPASFCSHLLRASRSAFCLTALSEASPPPEARLDCSQFCQVSSWNRLVKLVSTFVWCLINGGCQKQHRVDKMLANEVVPNLTSIRTVWSYRNPFLSQWAWGFLCRQMCIDVNKLTAVFI